MRKFYLVIVCTLLGCVQMFAQDIVETAYYSAHPELGGDVVINKSTKSFKDKLTSVTFALSASKAGNYYANFWLMPTQKPNGGYYCYAVIVNGKAVGTIKPTTSGWQSIGIDANHTVALVKGDNNISVIGMSPDVPNVEHVKLSTSKTSAEIKANNYNSFINGVQKSAMSMKHYAVTSVTSITDSLATLNQTSAAKAKVYYAPAKTNDSPLYDFEYRSGITANYTFYKTVSFTKGQQVFLATNGIDNFGHVLEFFSATTPETYSWSSMSNSNCMASLNITIPQTGMYYVRVRSYLNARSGFCNLNINGENYYSNIPVYSIGVRCTQGTDQEYNTFTVKSKGDPRLWIEEGSSIPGKISYYNDDYHGTGDFAWGLNSRIKKQFVRPIHAVLVSTYSSYNPTAKMDLYMKCKNSNIMPYFPNLKADDAIQSSPASMDYNCISWSGKITSYWEWPASIYSSYWRGDALSSFDAFYNSRGLTRVGANESNAVVALWAIVDANGNREYTHGSVRVGDGNIHGYAWESKPGALARTFHPRDALNGSSYGQIVEYYTTMPNSAQSSAAKAMTLEEEIANGTSQIGYVNFDEDEKKTISDAISNINSNVMAQFATKYDAWKHVTENTVFNSFSQMARCSEYYNTLNYCKKHPELINVLYEYLNNGDWATIKLIEDLINTAGNAQSYATRTNSLSDDSGIKTYRTPVSNCIAHVKSLLVRSTSDAKKTKRTTTALTGISYSNSNQISISRSNVGLNITFDLPETSAVSLDALDMSGTIVSTAFKSKRIEAGTHSASLAVGNNNVVLVRLMVNGHITVKKISLQ